MTYDELMTKLKAGEALTSDEYSELSKVTRPATRFNEVTAEKRQLEQEKQDLQAKLDKLEIDNNNASQKREDEFNEKLATLTERIESLSGENKDLQTFKAKSERRTAVSHIANVDCKDYTEGATFKDVDYLDMLLERKQVDITNKDAVKVAMQELKNEKPEQFVVSVNGGAGSGVNNNNNASTSVTKPEFKSAEERADFIAKYGFEKYNEMTQGE